MMMLTWFLLCPFRFADADSKSIQKGFLKKTRGFFLLSLFNVQNIDVTAARMRNTPKKRMRTIWDTFLEYLSISLNSMTCNSFLVQTLAVH